MLFKATWPTKCVREEVLEGHAHASHDVAERCGIAEVVLDVPDVQGGVQATRNRHRAQLAGAPAYNVADDGARLAMEVVVANIEVPVDSHFLRKSGTTLERE